MCKICCLIAIVALVAAASSQNLQAGSKVYVGAKVSSSRQVSMDRIDHSAFDALLRKYVDKDGMVAYRRLHTTSADIKLLDKYLRKLSTASLKARASRDGQLAFWINAYNAVTIRGILREYPTTSIRNHTARVFGYNIWKDLQLYVGGKPYSLEQIEHEVLRMKNDPRIHFAIVCASIGCPRLLNEAYVANRVQEQLENNARDFFSRSQNFHYDKRGRRFYLSSILSWFDEDFGRDQAALLRRIAPWLPSAAAQQAAKANSVRISYLDYNWKLNEQKIPRTARH